MLSVKCKTPVNFEFSDGIQVTTITIAPDEESESLRAKLQRVLELEGYANTPQRVPLPMLFQAPAEPQFTPADRAAEDARLAGVSVNGWNEDAVDGVDQLPEV